jgi:peptide/nickel transport system substrate-binding protein
MPTKTRLLFFLTLTVIPALLFTACGSSQSSAPSNTKTAGEQPASAPASAGDPGKSITIVIQEDPPSFNPVLADTGYDALVMELVMLGLTDIDPNGNIFPELAAELPTPDNGSVVVDEYAGNMSVTWKMRNDVQWQDGEPVTANDVLFTWEAIANPDTGAWIAGSDYIDSVEKVDQYSFTVRYNTIYPGYLTQFGGEQAAIWPAHYCDATQGFPFWDCGHKPLSNGPFVLEEWVEDDHMTFRKNENYYQAGKPDIEQVILQIVPEDTDRRTMMLEGSADIDMWINVDTIKELEGSDPARVSLSPTDRWVMRLFMNQAARGTTDPEAAPHPVLSDVNVRQAIRQAVDVDTINSQVFHGLANPVWTEFFRPPYQCEVPRPSFDPEAARVLLEESGWIDIDGDGIRECNGCSTGAPEGTKMEMEFLTYNGYGEPLVRTQQLIGEMLKNIGIQMSLRVVEGSELWALSDSGGLEQSGNFDIDLWDDGYAGVDPTDYVWETYSIAASKPDLGWNISHWQNEVVDALIDETYTLDRQTRMDTFCAIADFIHEEVPIIYLFTVPNADAYSARIEGVQSSVNDLVTWNIADWKLR